MQNKQLCKPLIVLFILMLLTTVCPVLHAQEDTPEKSWKIRTEISYARTSGNTSVETLAGKFNGEIGGEKNRYFSEMSLLRSKNGGVLSARRFYARARMERVFTGRLFGYIEADFLNDTFSGYDYRATAGVGLGIDILKGEHHQLKFLTAVKYIPEKYAAGPKSRDDYSAVNSALKYSWAIRENTRFVSELDYLVSLEDTQKYFANAMFGLEVVISKALSLGVSTVVNYQNQPPANTIKRTDTAFLSSLILSL